MNFTSRLLTFLLPIAILVPENGLAARLTTLNLYNRSYQKQERLDNALQLLKDSNSDLVALQEVGDAFWDSIAPDQILRQVLPLYGLTDICQIWQETNWGLFKNGLFLASRAPLQNCRYEELVTHWWDIKGALVVETLLEGVPVTVINVHLRSTEDEEVKGKELAALKHLVDSAATDGVLVMGDFNWNASSDQMKNFRANWKSQSANADLKGPLTWNPSLDESCDRETTGENHQQIDDVIWISKKGELKLGNPKLLVSERMPHPSDHCALKAELSH